MSTDFLQQKLGWIVDAELSLAPPAIITSASPLLYKEAMVYLQNPGSSEKMGSEDGSKKRKMEWNSSNSEWNSICNDGQKLSNSILGVELHLKSPLPPDWEQCLDLQSGQIYYINRRTQIKTWEDPRQGTNFNQLSKTLRLDLELNLPLAPKTQENDGGGSKSPASKCTSPFLEEKMDSSDEMVAIACMHCHMFVMLSKASPLCPNCKYVHPIDQISIVHKKHIAPARETLSLLDYGLQAKNKQKKDE
eukprot:Gb_27099 [translate_table: standard]